jgi:hypothetical protein
MTDPEKVQVTRWRCTHCRRSWATRRDADNHAARCWYDPANRACKTCEHFKSGRLRTPDNELLSADACRVGVPMPMTTTFGRERQTLHIDCDLHRLRASYAHPDVIDTLADAAP